MLQRLKSFSFGMPRESARQGLFDVLLVELSNHFDSKALQGCRRLQRFLQNDVDQSPMWGSLYIPLKAGLL